MKITEITVGRTFNQGNYESKKVSFTAKVKEDECLAVVIRNLENCCELANDPSAVEDAYETLANQEDYTGRQVNAAKELIEAAEMVGWIK